MCVCVYLRYFRSNDERESEGMQVGRKRPSHADAYHQHCNLRGFLHSLTRLLAVDPTNTQNAYARVVRVANLTQ